MDFKDIVIAVLVGYVVTDVALSMMHKRGKNLFEKVFSGDFTSSDTLISLAMGVVGGIIAYYIIQNYKELEETIEKTF